MASSKEFLSFILDQLQDLEGISHKAMMGEYILYYNGKIFGGIFAKTYKVRPIPYNKS